MFKIVAVVAIGVVVIAGFTIAAILRFKTFSEISELEEELANIYTPDILKKTSVDNVKVDDAK